MSQPSKPVWKWRYPKPPYGIRWPKKREILIPTVTRAEMERDGIPYNSPIGFVTEEHWNSLPASLAERDRPMTEMIFHAFMREVRASWAAAEPNMQSEKTVQRLRGRDLSIRQLEFARALANGVGPREAQLIAGYRLHRGNAYRLARNPRITNCIKKFKVGKKTDPS